MSTKIVKIPVPTSGYGVAVDVSDLTGEKTVVLSGKFRGVYVLYGTHDSTHFVPILSFNAGGIEGIRQTFSGTLRKVKLRSLVTESIGVEVSISGLQLPGNNSFTSFSVLSPGAQGPQGIVDLGATNYQVDLNFIAQGSLRGTVLVEGSLDGKGFNPVGNFSADPTAGSLLGGQELEFSPLGTADKVRYVRLNVRGEILNSFTVTIGGAQGNTGGTGSETLHEAYAVGISSVDQTLNLTNANGGKVVFDASDPGFVDPDGYIVEMLVPGGVGGAFLQDGGMVLGPVNIEIGTPQGPAQCYDPNSSIAIGFYAQSRGYDSTTGEFNVSIGSYAYTEGDENVALGPSAASISPLGGGYYSNRGCTAVGSYNQAEGNQCVAIGFECTARGEGVIVIGGLAISGDFSTGNGDIVIGQNASVYSPGPGSIVIGQSAKAGNNSIRGTNGAVVVGQQTTALGANDTVMGGESQTLDSAGSNVVIGYGVSIDSAGELVGGNVAVGQGVILSGNYSVAIGNLAQVTGDRSIALAVSDVTGTTPSIVQGDDSIVIGSSGFNEQTAVVGNRSLVIGWDSSITGNEDVCIGAASLIEGDHNVLVGFEARAVTLNPVGIGDDVSVGDNATTIGLQNIAIGYYATVGGIYGGSDTISSISSVGGGTSIRVHSTNPLPADLADGQLITIASTDYNGTYAISNVTASTFDMIIPWVADETGTWSETDYVFTNDVAIGSSCKIQGTNSVALGSAATIGDTSVLTRYDSSMAIGNSANVSANNAIALGLYATVTGDNGMAFGNHAVAGETEVVFSSLAGGGVSKFEVVSNDGSDDLFSFDVSKVGTKNTTTFSLLVTKNDGITTTVLPVTLSKPDPITLMSTLQVLNN